MDFDTSIGGIIAVFGIAVFVTIMVNSYSKSMMSKGKINLQKKNEEEKSEKKSVLDPIEENLTEDARLTCAQKREVSKMTDSEAPVSSEKKGNDEMGKQFCAKCGVEIADESAAFCSRCGNPLKGGQQVATATSGIDMTELKGVINEALSAQLGDIKNRVKSLRPASDWGVLCAVLVALFLFSGLSHITGCTVPVSTEFSRGGVEAKPSAF